MAEKKISQLTAKGATVADTDLLVVSESAGGGTYVTKSVTGANVKGLVTDANMTTTDITTNDVSTSKHGFVPKAPNDTTKFLRGDGTWDVPASGGLTKFTEAENTSAPNGTVYVDSLTAAASSTNADFAIVPKGTGALLADIPDNTSTGGNKRGQYAVDLQLARTAATQVASGNYSFNVGYACTSSAQASVAIGTVSNATGNNSTALATGSASGTGAIAIGNRCNASGTESIALGGYTYVDTIASAQSSFAAQCGTASASFATAIGYTTVASGQSSIALGQNSNTFSIYGRQSFSSGQVAVSGDCQRSIFTLGQRTTGNTATTLVIFYAAGTTPTTSNQVVLSNNSSYRFKGTIIGKQSGSTNVAAWDIDGIIVRGANAAATTLAISNVTLVQNTPAWGTPTLAADTTNGCLRVQVTGAATTNIQWTATIETTEVIYA